MTLACCMIALSLVGADDPSPGKPKPAGVALLTIEVKTDQTLERWPMDLATATHIALDNGEDIRVVELGVCSMNACFPLQADGPVIIARLNADTSVGQFKTDAMALVRSVEQQYWNLAQAQALLESAEQAVRTTRDLIEQAQAKLTLAHCDPGVADLAEAEPRLEQFNNDVVTRKADVIAAEIALRKILGIPPIDNRRIITSTKPAEELLSFDWDTCVEEMLREQPDNVQQQGVIRLAELCLLMTRYQFILPLDAHTLRQLKNTGPLTDTPNAVLLSTFLKMFDPLTSSTEFAEGIDLSGNAAMDSLTCQRGFTFQAPLVRGPMSNTRQAQYILLRERARQRRVLCQTTQSLARSFLEVDANYKQYAAGRRLQAAAEHRLDVQRAYYEEGRIRLDRFLDSVNQNAQSIATVAHYKTTYNISIAALSEAKGTLLADRGIAISEPPDRRTQRPS
jgi:Outer membrane efflux protein